jgi:quinoprotein glucose dehydrogenase
LVYNPGTALRPEDRERFYLADFRGSPGDSGVRRFGLRSKGAAFELVDETQFVWGLEATDVAFGVDGALYISDWVEGWNKTGKGRIYRISEENVSDGAQKESTRELLAKGVGTSNVQELAGLLAHPDQRVRQMAQFELARRAIEKERALNGRAAGPNDLLELSTIAGIALSKTQPRAPTVARFHATCAWWQVERARGGKHSDLLMQLLSDDEPAIRLQAARALNDLIASDGPSTVFPSGLGDGLVKATSDSDKRVALYAAMALGGLAKAEFVEPLRLLLQKNDDADAYLRHAGVMGLSGIAASQPKLVWALADDSSSAVRMGVLLVMRKLRTAEVARFLNDPDPRVALEAARAIYDTAIDEALPALADRKIDRNTPTPLVRRVVAARFRRGSSEDAAALANLCAAPGFTSSLRIEFINTLADWASAPPLDRITGLYRPVAKHEAAEAAAALSQTAPALLRDESELVVQAAERAVAALKLTPLVPRLIELAKDGDRSSSTRVEALRALDALSAPGLPKVVREAIKDKNRSVRAEALAILARVDPSEALGVLKEVLNTGTVEEKQRGFATLATIDDPQVDPLLGTWLDRLLAGDVPPTVRLDLLEAAEQRKSAPIEEKLARYQASLPKDDPLAAYEATLEGGRAARGERIFREKAEVSCLRCHKIRGQGGEVGPELTGIGGKKDRRYLLQALVTPDAQIAEGFDTKVLALKDGRLVSGIVKRADEHELTLVNAEAHTLVVPRAQIEEETRGQSAMPQDVSQKLTRQELRDLIEYLSSLR